jgi:hypothetical protein
MTARAKSPRVRSSEVRRRTIDFIRRLRHCVDLAENAALGAEPEAAPEHIVGTIAELGPELAFFRTLTRSTKDRR